MHHFSVIIEKANGNYSAYSPDLPGCIATGKTREETERNMHEAIQICDQELFESGTSVGWDERRYNLDISLLRKAQ